VRGGRAVPPDRRAAAPDRRESGLTMARCTAPVPGHRSSAARVERGSRTDEAIGLLRELWTAEPVSHHGRHFHFDDVGIHPAPTQPGGPPIVVAGRQPAAMRRAALLGDGWMPYLYSPERYERSVAEIRSVADAAGRDLVGFDWTAFPFVNVDADSAKASAATAAFLGGNYRQRFDEMVDHVAVAGSIAQVTDRLGQFRSAGAEHFIIAIAAHHGQVEMAELLAAEVLPQL
jgi:alkanesulfonate monooxygenase SsuD/methylene tetrahydromethanopterin reductase-like flavin-dependent oxidoreductase (luciferase family)